MTTKLYSKGDVVTVRGTVRYDIDASDTGVGIEIKGHHQTVFVDFDKVTLVHRHFDVGQRVWNGNEEIYGYVRAVNGGVAWVQLYGDCYRTFELKDLEPADELQDVDAIAA
jgi:hypothetical protein